MAHLFFDLDGTLADSAEGIMRAYAYMMDAFSLPYESYTDFRRVVGPPLFDCFKEDGIPSQNAQKALALFQEYYARKGVFENNLYDGIKETLSALKERQNMLYLVTSKPELFAKQILDRLALTPFFTDIIGADMAETFHKKEDLLRAILKRNGLFADSSMAMIGDRSYDVIGAHAVGMRGIGVLWGIGSQEELQKAGADMLLRTPMDLLRCLKQA